LHRQVVNTPVCIRGARQTASAREQNSESSQVSKALGMHGEQQSKKQHEADREGDVVQLSLVRNAQGEVVQRQAIAEEVDKEGKPRAERNPRSVRPPKQARNHARGEDGRGSTTARPRLPRNHASG